MWRYFSNVSQNRWKLHCKSNGIHQRKRKSLQLHDSVQISELTQSYQRSPRGHVNSILNLDVVHRLTDKWLPVPNSTTMTLCRDTYHSADFFDLDEKMGKWDPNETCRSFLVGKG